MMILTYLVSVNGFIGMITFKPKYMEQIYGQSASKAIFLIGTARRLAPIHFSAGCTLLFKAAEMTVLLKGSVIVSDSCVLKC